MKSMSFAIAAVLLTCVGVAAQDGAPVATYSGSGGTTTRPFTVDSGWEIQWEAEGSIFQLYLHSGAGEMVGVAANQQGSGPGSSYQPASGEFYLQVNAIGAWEVRVVPVTGLIDATSGTEFEGSGGSNTRPFRVSDRWEIQWAAEGSLFQVYLYSANGDLVGVPVNQQGGGEGASYQPAGGDYYLQVNSTGPWKVVVSPVGGQQDQASNN